MGAEDHISVKERLRVPHGPLLIFGSGPVIDSKTRDLTAEGETGSAVADGTFWLHDLALAAAELYKLGAVHEIVALGGRTGGKENPSEAQLLKQEIVGYGVPEDNVKTEDYSKDTISNLINLLNMTEGSEETPPYQILGTQFHTPRIQILMQLLRLPFKDVFKAESTLAYVAESNPANPDNVTLNRLDRELDPNDNLSLREKLGRSIRSGEKRISFYQSQKKGIEQTDYAFKIAMEDLLIRELLEYPESWLGRIVEIKNPQKRRDILKHAEKIYPGVLSKYGIDLDKANDNDIQSQLMKIEKHPLDNDEVVEWIKQDVTESWPKEVEDRFVLLVEERRLGK